MSQIDLAPFVDRCRRMLVEGHSLDEVLTSLRQDGLEKVHSIKVLVEGAGMSLAEAKALVHSSAAWSDVRERDDEFHRQLVDQLDLEKGP